MRRLVVAGLALLGLAPWAFAQTSGAVGSRSAHAPGSVEETREHEHGPRHGGQFGDAEDLFHFELALEPSNRLVFYVNDESNHPLDVRILQARWTLNPDDPHPATGTFTASPDGASFSTTLPPITTNQAHVEVAVLKSTQWVAMEFFLPVASRAEITNKTPDDRPAPQTY